MNRIVKFFKGVMQAMRHPRQWLLYGLHGTKFDFINAVGDGQDSSVVMAPVLWIARNAIQARPEMLRVDRDEPERIVQHEMLDLLCQPNPHYSGKMLKMATLISLCTAGDAFWIKVRGSRKRVAELWYAPHFLMSPEVEPGSTQQSYIDFYKYQTGGVPTNLLPSEVIHFRCGINPRNTRRGISPMFPAIREIYADIESANFTGALLRNFGIPGVVISPESWETQASVQVDAKDVKEKYMETFSGDRRGEPLVMTGPTKVETFGFSPDEMSLNKIRNVSEERVCALLGVQPSVVGFGTGLEQTKVGATMVENRRASWEDGILPFLDILAETITESLLPEFETNPDPYEMHYNTSRVRALAESQDKIWQRASLGVRNGWVRVDQAQGMVGLQPDPSQAVYLRNFNVAEIPAKASPEHWAGIERKGLPAQIYTNGQPALPAVKQQPPRGSAQLLAQMARDQVGLEQQLNTETLDMFEGLGAALEQSTLQVLGEKSAKQVPIESQVQAELILEGIVMLDFEKQLQEIFGKHYARTTDKMVNAINATMSVSVRVPDPVAREIVATGGRRAGLVDLSDSVRRRLFAELAEGQRLGLGAPQLARNVRAFVPAGPWRTPDVRAKVIARTETMHAQRVSALHTYRHMDANAMVMVFDGRLPTSCDECIALDGQVVTQAEASALADTEHPNGTRAFVIYYE